MTWDQWLILVVCGGGIVYCWFTMPKKMIMRKESYTALAHAVNSKQGQKKGE